MTTIKDIMRIHGPEYVRRFGNAMPIEHHKAVNAIINCRTDFFGASLYQCEDCGQKHLVFRCCGNRHCPTCQHHKTRKWLEQRLDQQLPVHHFMITFTVPDKVRLFIRSHQRIGYNALFAASSATIKKLALDNKFIGADLPGFFGVLHTWGRMMPYHPHIHYVVPGGAMSKSNGQWHPSRADFFLPVKAMSKVFKAKFRDQMKKSGLASSICPDAWKQAWVVNCKAVGTGARSIKYLAPYVFKVAISNSRIIKIENRQVLFKYRKSGSNRWRTASLEVMEFIRRFLQHVLPNGFMKVRYYGFMSPGSSVSMEKVKACIVSALRVSLPRHDIKIAEPVMPACPDCGGRLIYHSSFVPFRLTSPGAG